MIPQIHKQGSHTLGLLYYLYGKGTHEEHVDPHLVASFDGMSPDPGRDATATKKDLGQLLDQPLHLLAADRRPDKHVWHCSVRAAPDDPILTDDQWADMARRIVAATGIDPRDGAGCRWATCGTLTTTSISLPPSCAKTADAPTTTDPVSGRRSKPVSSRRNSGSGRSPPATAPPHSGPPVPNGTRPNARVASAPPPC
ncbi:hypothetical protein SPURM210S_00893 [Streptomyces purpurascens]